jgi:tetrahydromethanopterin S-methyltransferase subunit G
MTMTEEKTEQYELEKKLDELSKKLDNLESKVNRPSTFGQNVWVLIPVAAIIMWGLTNIL